MAASRDSTTIPTLSIRLRVISYARMLDRKRSGITMGGRLTPGQPVRKSNKSARRSPTHFRRFLAFSVRSLADRIAVTGAAYTHGHRE